MGHAGVPTRQLTKEPEVPTAGPIAWSQTFVPDNTEISRPNEVADCM